MKSLAFKDLESYTEEQIPSWVGICFLDLSKIDLSLKLISIVGYLYKFGEITNTLS